MPPKETNGSLTARETELIVAWVKCMESKPPVDYEKFASLTGYANANSALRNMNKLWNKLSGADGGASDASGSPPKRKADADDGVEDESLAKKKAASKKGKKGAEATGETAMGQVAISKEAVDGEDAEAEEDAAVKEEDD